MKHFLYFFTMEEIWKDIEGYENLYQVSNMGRVKSMGNGNSNKSKEMIMKQTKNRKGYHMIRLCKEGVGKGFSVHRLVAQAFIPNPNNLPQVNHIDEEKTNNIVDNLEWCTAEYNVKYGTRTDKTSKQILQITSENKVVRFWKSIRNVENVLGFSNSNIQKCCVGKKNTAYGYKWQYVDDYLADWWEEEMEKATF